jgi:hypothetical protein
MNKIICPNSKKAFKIDEAGFANSNNNKTWLSSKFYAKKSIPSMDNLTIT